MTEKHAPERAKDPAKGKPRLGSSRPIVDASQIPLGKRRVLTSFPVRTEHKDLKWYRNKKDGHYILKMRKNFTRFERSLRRIAGGPEWLRIPLDPPGSRIWELCDGKHTIVEIAKIMQKEFKEELEPVLPRVIKFLEMLLKRNLIELIGTAKPCMDLKDGPIISENGTKAGNGPERPHSQ
jgi:hypothetical protein